MDSQISFALQIALIGMSTVFLMLSLVVLISKWLIHTVNKFCTETPRSSTKAAAHRIPHAHIAAVTAVTEHVTHSRGQITSIMIHQNNQ